MNGKNKMNYVKKGDLPAPQRNSEKRDVIGAATAEQQNKRVKITNGKHKITYNSKKKGDLPAPQRNSKKIRCHRDRHSGTAEPESEND